MIATITILRIIPSPTTHTIHKPIYEYIYKTQVQNSFLHKFNNDHSHETLLAL